MKRGVAGDTIEAGQRGGGTPRVGRRAIMVLPAH
jgi:hypothetical protein